MTHAQRQSALFEIAPATPASAPRTEKKRVARSRVETRIETICDTGPFDLNRVHQADCIAAMRQMSDASVDIAIADPPYNASKGNNWGWDNSVNLPGFGGNWPKVMAEWDDMPLADYFTFTLAWLSQLKRVVRPTGSLWGTSKNPRDLELVICRRI
jgi:hypothetical protein